MRHLAISLVMTLASATATAAQVDPATTKFPWKNGSDAASQYIMAEHKNTVHVFEAFSLGCSWCNKNAPQVAAMSEEFKADSRVQFIDLGLDTSNSDYKQWIQRHAPPYPVVQDVGRKVWNALKQDDGIPQTFVVDCKGKLVDYTIGYWGAEEKATIRQAIARAEATTCE